MTDPFGQPRRLSLRGSLMRCERARLQAHRTAIDYVIERRAQAAMIVIFKRHEAERLQHSAGYLAHGTENFRHAMNRAGLRLKSHFDEVALRKRLGQLQEPAGDRDGLEFRFGAAAVFEADRSQDGISKLDPGRAPGRVRLGEVGHT